MGMFNRLPGFVRSAPGLEWKIWKRLPAIWLAGTVPPLLVLLGVYLWAPVDALGGTDPQATVLGYIMVGVIVLYASLVLTLAIGCAIVMVMKGPAYVADAYVMQDSDRPAPPGSAQRG